MKRMNYAIIVSAILLAMVAQANPNAVINLDAHYDENHALVTPDVFLLQKALKALDEGYNKSAYQKFKQAAAFGNAQAFKFLGLMNIKELGVSRDWAKGYAWIQLAALDNRKENLELKQNILRNLKPEELEQSKIEFTKLLEDYSSSETLKRRDRWVQRQKRKTTGSRTGSQTSNVKSQSIGGTVISTNVASSNLKQMNSFVNDYQFGVVTIGEIIPVEKEAKK